MATTDKSLCNSALLLIGAEEINSFDDNTLSAKLAKQLYATTKDSVLQSFPWRFSLKQKDLGGRLVAQPIFDWQYQYQLPADLLRMIAMQDDRPYEIYGDKIYTDELACKIIYQVKTDEAEMPAYFQRALEFQLARLFAMSLQEDMQKANLFDSLAQKEIVKARGIDSQQQPNSFISDVTYSTINVRS